MIMVFRRTHGLRTTLCCSTSRTAYLHPRVEIIHHNGCRSFGSTSKPHEDDGLRWAKANPEDAKSCLAAPEVHSSSSLLSCPSFTTWEEYWKWRCWKFPVRQDNDDEKSQSTNVSLAKRLVSHILSAPLTLAYHTTLHFPSLPQHWCCVGARAEATLPNEYWKELLVASHIEKKNDDDDDDDNESSNNNNNNNSNNWILNFVGPDVPKIPSRSLAHGESVLDLHWHSPGYLHAMNDPPGSNLFVLFNPGLGHSNLAKGWRPTIEHLVAKNAPLVLTAHSQRDAERDEKVLQEYFNNVQYELNPFRSRITYEDPFLKGHLVSPNQYVAVIKPPI